MRFSRVQSAILAFSLLTLAVFLLSAVSPVAHAQTITTGAISGVVADQTGAVVPDATVTVVDTTTNAQSKVTANGEGRYTIGLLKPDLYKVSASTTNMRSETIQVTVAVGATAAGDIKVTPEGNAAVVEVLATDVPLVDTENDVSLTTFNEEQIQDLPTPGGDITTIAFTAPGVVVNAGGSYGNFSSNGLPGISNLFVLNGFDDQDPFLNLNNSGSSNLTLGQGEEEESTVVQNGYDSQFGRAAGAILSVITKSGGNQFHGEAIYNYNGTVLNANGWFNEFNGAPRPHAVSNEWAVNTGGPIVKDKLFFFGDYEGLRYVLPASGYFTAPSSQLETYTLNTIAAEGLPSAVTNFANQTFALYNAAATKYKATAQNGTCGFVQGTTAPNGGVFDGGGANSVPCMVQGYGTANNINIEWLATGRIDWHINDKHTLYGRVKVDRGSQPTYTSFISPTFDTVSIQPEDEGQFNDRYTFSPNLINSFVTAATWYTAFFGPANDAAVQAVYPFFSIEDAGLDGSGTNQSTGLSLLGVPSSFPQGRNVTQYQFEDDVTWVKGKNNFKFGGNFRRDLVSDYDQRSTTIFPQLLVLDLADFTQFSLGPNNIYYPYNSFTEAFTNAQTAHLALYNLGLYFQDELQASKNLKITFGARVDRTGDPFCQRSCFSIMSSGNFGPGSATPLNDPYPSSKGGLINSANSYPFPSIQLFNLQPRVGFNYSLDTNTSIRGGMGLFSDLYPAGFLDGVIQNFPNYFAPGITSGNIAPTGTGNLLTAASQANTTIQNDYKNGKGWGGINTDLVAQNVFLSSPPNIGAYFPSEFKVPEYVEFNLQIQRQLGKYDAILFNYVGNRGIDGVIINPLYNPASGTFDPNKGAWVNAGYPDIGGIPDAPTNQDYGRVTAYTNNGKSNYNGLQISYKHNGHGFEGQLNYTWSHSLDDVSNGGEGEPWSGGSVTTQLTPSLGPGNLNYSNSDYDVRNNLTGDVIYTDPYKSSNKLADMLLGGWKISAKTYYRSGNPFSMTTTQSGSYQDLTTLMAQTVPGATKLTNIAPSNPHGCVVKANVPGPCFGPQIAPLASSVGAYTVTDTAAFVPPTTFDPGNGKMLLPGQTTFGNVRRNSFFGPHYANTDLSFTKRIVKIEKGGFSIGASAYNAFNHANFAAPGSGIGSSSFGTITSVVAPPTSPYGSFQSAAVTQRVLVVQGKLVF